MNPTLNQCNVGSGTHGGEPAVLNICYGLDALNSNSMKSKNPKSGCHQDQVAKTLDTAMPDPTKNQGGQLIVEKEIDNE